MVPKLEELFSCNPVNDAGCTSPIATQKGGSQPISSIGDLISIILSIAFFAAVFLAFYWLAWGAFAYIMAQGKKEDLAKARARITWALIGLFFVFLSYFIAKFMSEVFKPGTGGLPF